MDYVLESSLQHMALTKIAITLWDQDNVMVPTAMHLLPSLEELQNFLLVAENKVMERVPRLLLPEPLKKKVVKFISGIGREILRWRKYHYEWFNFDIVLPSELCWTPHGTVDTKKTAEAFIQNENIDVTRRYRLACQYCLEDDIPNLWDKISENFIEEFDCEMEQDLLMVYWTYHMMGEMDKLDQYTSERKWRNESLYQYAIERAVSNKSAAEYFLQRLTFEEREESLVISAYEVAWQSCYSFISYFPSILCFLLSVMDEWEQIEVFKNEPHLLLNSFLEWPWQSVFMETANRMWDILPGEDFRIVLTGIVCNVREGYKDYDYKILFEEFWQQSSNAHKEYIFAECKTSNPFFLLDLLEMENKEEVSLILNSATVEEREDIIFSPGGNSICERLVNIDGWVSVKFFLQECLSSKEVMIEFKKKFKEHMRWEMSERPAKYAGKENEWDKFFQLVDDLIEENNNKVTRFQQMAAVTNAYFK